MRDDIRRKAPLRGRLHQVLPVEGATLAPLITDKLFFKIGEVARLVGVEPHVLRYWETEFREIAPGKSRTNQRLYRRRDVERILKVRGLLYNEGYTIEGARRKLRELIRAEEKPPKVSQLPIHFSGRSPEKEVLVKAKQELEAILQLLES